MPRPPRAATASPYPRLLGALRRRLDALQAGQVEEVAVWDRVLAPLLPASAPGALPTLAALSRDLDRLGVHTVADARLLRDAAAQEGPAAELAQGLARRVQRAVGELQRELRRAERGLLAGQPVPGATTALAGHFARLVRAARVADVFAGEPLGDGAGGPEAPFLLQPAVGPSTSPPGSARLAVAEHLAARARAEVADVAQKRRDLDVAHELLLRMSGDLDRQRTRRVRLEVAQARARARALGGPMARTLEAQVARLQHQARVEPRAAYRELLGLYTRAVDADREALARGAWAALSTFLADGTLVHGALAPPPRVPGPGPVWPAQTQDDALADLAFQLGPEQRRLFELAAGCAHYFDVEEALGKEVVEGAAQAGRPAPGRRTRQVPYPTQHLELGTTGSPRDVASFLIEDPRRVLLELAGHRQPVRVYREEEPPSAPRRVRRSSVRVYVCDASGSMHGHRARFRDALLLAELQNLRERARRGEPVDPLYYCFFNDTPQELARVDGAAGAVEHMERLFRASPAEGQTDITLALLSAFDSIRAAWGREPSLARATVVLVTDGEDRVDLARVRQARAPVAGVSTALSLISLGEENPDLRALAVEQRAQGARAFYHHLTDDDVLWAHSAFEVPWRTLLPPDLPVTHVDLAALTPHLEALRALARGDAVPEVRPPRGSFDALFPDPSLLRARAYVAARGAAPAERVADVLEAVLEAAALVPPGGRAEEAVRLLEHLRALYGLELPAYLGTLASGDPRVDAALGGLRLLCRPLG